MKTKLITFAHASNGLALYLVPESDIERELLKGLIQHGTLEMGNGIADNSPQGYSIRWKLDESDVP